MRRIAVAVVTTVLALVALSAVPPSLSPQPKGHRDEGERLVREGSYKLALDEYKKIDRSALESDDDRRWVDFRLADLLWRSAPENNDPTRINEAERALEKLLSDDKGNEIRDRVWAEAQESLGDLAGTRRRDWNSRWQHYSAALDWWAGARDTELARTRYIAMVWKAQGTKGVDRWAGYYGPSIPLAILENVAKIATSEADKSHAAYLIAVQLSQRSDPESVERMQQVSQEAIAAGRTSEWYDDALYLRAQWLERSGILVPLDSGFRVEPDYEGAVATYKRLLGEFKAGETQYWDEAKQRVEAITKPSLGLAVSNVFLPGSKAEFSLQSRNVAEVELALTRVDLTTDLTRWISGAQASWYYAVDAASGHDRVAWTKAIPAKKYQPFAERVTIERDLAPGAWLLEAKAGNERAREIVLVSDAAIVTRTSGSKALIWVTDARSGEPRANAKVSLWSEYWDGNSMHREQKAAATDANGVAEIALRANRQGQMLVFANANGQQAFSQAWGYGRNDREDDDWRIYAVTDRPAYRPGETAHWKITARISSPTGYSVPASRALRYEIVDPRGATTSKGSLTLNAFGSAWADLALDASMPLGEYHVTFYDGNRSIGYAVLFRLEEYKLPEFRVTVSTTDDKGKPRLYRLGDKVEVAIDATYYSGGPVANATVEAIVRQSPYYRVWFRPHEYPWYFDDDRRSRNYYGGEGPNVKQVTLTTDQNGRAHLEFDTPQYGSQDLDYHIEVRVTDASRREITARGSVRVTNAPYFAEARPKHWLYRPGDSAEIEFKTLDANDQPAAAAGTLVVTRDEWKEVWLDPKGNEVSGKQLDAVREREAVFPPPAQPGQHPWLRISYGYEHEKVLETTVKTGETGRGVFKFTPQKEGYYRFAWYSRPAAIEKPRPRDTVEASTTIWVATRDSVRIGYYRESGVEILLDEDTVRPGATVPVMVAMPSSDRYVLIDTEGDDFIDRQVVHAQGNVKLIELKLGDQHIPNFFLTATTVRDLAVQQDTKEIVVPPRQKFLSLELTADREQHQPGEEGTLAITARDADGKPVKAEVSLGVADDSVYAIHEDYAGDPRPFFYGVKRGQKIQTSSSFALRSYVKLVEKDGRLVDQRYAGNPAADRRLDRVEGGVVGGVVGGSVGGYANRNAVAESIAVRADARQLQTAAAPPPAPPPAPAMKSVRNEAKAKDEASGAEAAVQVRSDFRSTIFWKPDVVTGDDGRATITFRFPDSLTTWRAVGRAATVASQFGTAAATTRTNKPLIVRLQAPRFFVVGDRVVISGVINNNSDRKLTVTPSLDAAGVSVTGLFVDGKAVKGETAPVAIEPDGEARVDWMVSAQEPGTARLRVVAKGGEFSDAMEKTYPVEEHGIDKLVAASGKMRGGDATLKLDIPRERRATTMTVQVAPSIAVTMLDALPYLIGYPYGCTEQTMSRFLPTVIVAKTLADLGIPRQTVASRLFGGIEEKSAAKTHTRGRSDLEKLDEMTRAGLSRLYDFQHGEGGWGWWKDGSSDHHMTAYVVWGLALARDAGINVRGNVIDAGVAYLQRELVKEEFSPDRQAWMLHALAATAKGRTPSKFEQAAIDNLWKKRDELSTYGLALFAKSTQQFGLKEQALTLSRNLENGADVDAAPDASLLVKGSGSGAATVMSTAHWGSSGFWWRWYDSPVESTALALQALVTIDPKHRLVEPSMNWLVKNRRGAQWSNTRDTAMAVMALADYLRTTGELGGDVEYEVLVNGEEVASKKIAAADMIAAPTRITVPARLVRDGANIVTVRKTKGSGALYIAAEARFVSLEEPVKAAGNEIFVKRQYEKVVGRPTLLKGFVYDKVPMKDGDAIRSGERLDVVVTVDVKNDYEYLLLEDLKPAGLEAVELLSGTSLFARKLKASAVEEKHGAAAKARKPAQTVVPPDNDSFETRWVYQELRDRKVAMFIDKLTQGVWEIRYTLRAEVPGTFHALPLLGGAMYVPEIKANSDELRITVEER